MTQGSSEIQWAVIPVVHRLPGRVRLRVPGLQGNHRLAGVIAASLSQKKGVFLVRASALTGRVLVCFDESNLKLPELNQLIHDCLVLKKQPSVMLHPSPPEPEDLPVKKQFFNVALGGGVLAYLTIKHLLVGRSPLARDPHIFNLAAAATIISGYPVLRSGLHGLTRGKINYDLLLGALALGTTLARESIPGLTVMWLTNLAALVQSLMLQRYLKALPVTEGNARSLDAATNPSEWEEAGRTYGHKFVLPALGAAALTGLTGGWSKALAMLLAANPSPAGLAAPTTRAAVIAAAGKQGILFRHPGAVEKLAKLDTVIIDRDAVLSEAAYEVGDILPLPGISKAGLLAMAAQHADSPFDFALRKALFSKGVHPAAEFKAVILTGDEKTLNAAGIDTGQGIYKARRLQHLQQVPLFVACNGQLAGLIGIKPGHTGDLRCLVQSLRSLGVRQVLLLTGQSGGAMEQVARDLGIVQVGNGLSPEEKLHLVQQLQQQGRVVALVQQKPAAVSLSRQADITVCACGSNNHAADVVLSNISLLPEACRLAQLGRQRVKQNIALVQAANVMGLALASTGRLSAMAAKVYGDLVALAVCSNAGRLLWPPNRSASPWRPAGDAQREIAAALEETVINQCSNWHSLTVAEALYRLGTNLQNGLSGHEVQQRLALYGPNQVAEEKPPGFLSRIWNQLKDFLVKTLLASAVTCAILGEFWDALAIVTILALNALLGALQEQKAEGALQALAKLTAPTARVRREGKVTRIPACQLVPGDIVLLEQGDGVPADLRLLETTGLEIEESALTGESYPVAKSANPISDCIPLLDCENLAFMGTNVTRGRGVGMVIATGMSSEIGKIAGMLNQEKSPTPLQNRMAEVSGVILKYCLAVSGLVVLGGVLRGGSLFKMFLTGVSLAVAAIPEGLPAVVTIALASGVRRMAKENAVVRHLPAVETLGSATLIATDKTGTLTQNRQQVQAVFTGSGWWQAAGERPLTALGRPCPREELTALLTAGILCNNAELKWVQSRQGRGKTNWQVEGDPTEGALLLAGLREEINYRELREKWQRIKELPFDAERLHMTVICQAPEYGYMVFVKGAPEVVVNMCTQMQQGEQAVPLNNDLRRQVLQANENMAAEAMRVLAVAYRPLQQPEQAEQEKSLILLGLVGMVDPPRPEVRQAVATCHRAGIKVVMITGDHPHTALAVARQVGICRHDRVMTGRDIDNLTDPELVAAINNVRVFARVLPGQKLRLVQAFRQRGEILAMVGDGINDAPAIKEADIGVAMGVSGTDVTKQAADIILTDDHFATLVSAVEQGRGIYANIRRSVRYLLATNVGLVMLVLLAVLLGLPMPLLPIQLLFLNVLGDGLPALALGVAPYNSNLMQRPPRPVNEGFFADGLGNQIISRGIATGLIGLETYRRTLKQGDQGLAGTVTMASFMASKLLFALECGEKKQTGANPYLTGSVALSALLLGGAIYLPVGRQIFKTTTLGLKEVGTVLGSAGLTYVAERCLTAFINSQQNEKTSINSGSSPN
ncbi:hypothetical protein JCM39194_13610 [Desulfotomaculum varum]